MLSPVFNLSSCCISSIAEHSSFVIWSSPKSDCLIRGWLPLPLSTSKCSLTAHPRPSSLLYSQSWSHFAWTSLSVWAKARFLLLSLIGFFSPASTLRYFFFIVCICEQLLSSNSSELWRKMLYSIALYKYKIIFILHKICWWNQCDSIKAKSWKINPFWSSLANKLLKLRMAETFTAFSKVFNCR